MQWSTASEIDAEGFHLYRAAMKNGEYIKINDDLIPAEGSPTEGASYEFIDRKVKNRGTYWYWLVDIDVTGLSTLHGPVRAVPRRIKYMIDK